MRAGNTQLNAMNAIGNIDVRGDPSGGLAIPCAPGRHGAPDIGNKIEVAKNKISQSEHKIV